MRIALQGIGITYRINHATQPKTNQTLIAEERLVLVLDSRNDKIRQETVEYRVLLQCL